MLQAILSEGILISERFEIIDIKSAEKWYLKRGYKKVIKKESTHVITVGEMSNGCFIQGSYKNIYLIKNNAL